MPFLIITRNFYNIDSKAIDNFNGLVGKANRHGFMVALHKLQARVA